MGPRLILALLALGALVAGCAKEEEAPAAGSEKATTVKEGENTAATGGPKLEINPDYKAPK